ncbi:hypothetical protein QUF72_01315 [Desulfobacterales bacterium HSG2]|nr:hypothetical protein [Desulfobacterales bacterium HSG2]
MPVSGCQLSVSTQSHVSISAMSFRGNIIVMSFRQHQRHVIPGNIEKKELFFNVDPESIAS